MPGPQDQECPDKVKKVDQAAVKRALHGVVNPPNIRAARAAARKFADRFADKYPAAVVCLRNERERILESMLRIGA